MIWRKVCEGFPVHIGMNALSNERLVKEHPHRDCIWFHAISGRGSHVVLCIQDRPEPVDAVVVAVARICLDYSKTEFNEVRYAKLSDVYKPDGAGPGIWHTKLKTTIEVPV